MRPRKVFSAVIGGSLAALAVAESAAADPAATLLLPEDQEVRIAREAAPEHLRAEASVYVFATDGYRLVRQGTNGFTCLVNRHGDQNGDTVVHPTCWDAEGSRTIVPVELRVGELIACGASAEEIRKDIDADFASGRFKSPQKAGIAYMLRGDLTFDRKTRTLTGTAYPPHYMTYAPGVSGADIGMAQTAATSEFALPSAYNGYSGGARTAYIIVPAALGGGHTH